MLISWYRESEKGNAEHMFDFESEVLPSQDEVVYFPAEYSAYAWDVLHVQHDLVQNSQGRYFVVLRRRPEQYILVH